jgi:uncharacterized membrane protein YGL010W
MMNRMHASELLVRYAAAHRDQRNIASHLVAMPLVVFALFVLLARAGVAVGGVELSAATVLFGLAALWWTTRGLPSLGLATSAAAGILLVAAHPLAELATGVWLAWGLGVLALGWLAQRVGHWYEGRRPAVDERVGLLVGPLFATAEVLFGLGWNRPLQAEIARRVGPAHLRDIARIA